MERLTMSPAYPKKRIKPRKKRKSPDALRTNTFPTNQLSLEVCMSHCADCPKFGNCEHIEESQGDRD